MPYLFTSLHYSFVSKLLLPSFYWWRVGWPTTYLPGTEGFPWLGTFSATAGGVPDKLEWLVILEETKDHQVTSQKRQNMNSCPRFPGVFPLYHTAQSLEIPNLTISDHIFSNYISMIKFFFLESNDFHTISSVNLLIAVVLTTNPYVWSSRSLTNSLFQHRRIIFIY